MNLECYNNVAFWTSERVALPGDEYFEQAYNGTRVHTVATTWGHTAPGVIEEGKAGLTAEDYPQMKVFNSGSTYDNERIKTFNPEQLGYNIASAELSSSVTMSDNAAVLNGAGEYVTFKNVEFGDKYNAFALLYRASQYNTGDQIKITLGERTSSSLTTTMSVDSAAATLKNNVLTPVYIYGCKGTTDVTVESTSYESLEIAGIIPIKVEESLIDAQIMGKTFANNYAQIVTDPKNAIVSSSTGTSGNPDEMAINSASGGAVIKYSDVIINRDVNNFVLAAGSSSNKAGDILEIRIGDLNSKPIASIMIPDHGYNTYTPVSAALNEVLKAGKYDIYLSFTDSSKTSNVWWFGFNVTERGE